MSLPARLRPAAPVRPPAAHPRSASLGHPGGEGEPVRSGARAPGTAGRGHLANQQQKWCFSEPGKLDLMGQGGGMVGECLGGACSSFGLARPETQELQHQVLAEFEGHQIRWLRGAEDLEPRSLKLDNVYRPARRSHSTSGEALGPWGGTGGAMPIVQVWKGCRLGIGGIWETENLSHISSNLFAFPDSSSRNRTPQTIVSDQTFQVRDTDHS